MLYQTTTELQTLKLGQKLAKEFHGGEVVLLQGNLGSGKTVLAKGIAKGLGIKKVVTSPTFVLFKVYPITRKQHNKKTTKQENPPSLRYGAAGKKTTKQIKYLVHADCYRLEKGGDILDAGLAEYIGRPDAVVLIEWGERVGRLPLPVSRISFKLKGGKRVIDVKKTTKQ